MLKWLHSNEPIVSTHTSTYAHMLVTKTHSHKRLQIENKSKQLPFLYVTQHKQWCFARAYTAKKSCRTLFGYLVVARTNYEQTKTGRKRNKLKLILHAHNGYFSFRFVVCVCVCLNAFECKKIAHQIGGQTKTIYVQ